VAAPEVAVLACRADSQTVAARFHPQRRFLRRL